MSRCFAALMVLTLTHHASSAEPTFHGKTFAQWSEVLKRGTPKERGRAATALGLGPFGDKAVAPLLQAFGDRDKQVQARVIVALGDVGPEAKPAIPFLAALITDEEEDHTAIFEALGKIGLEAAPAILKACKKLDKYSRDASDAIRKMGQPAIPLLVKAMKEDEKIVRLLAMVLGNDTKGDAIPAIPALVLTDRDDPRFLDFDSPFIVFSGPTAEAFVPVFMKLLENREHASRAARGLVKLGKPAFLALREIFDKGSSTARLAVLDSLEPDWEDALPLVLKYLKGRDVPARKIAARVLHRFRVDLGDHLPELREGLKDPDLTNSVLSLHCSQCHSAPVR